MIPEPSATPLNEALRELSQADPLRPASVVTETLKENEDDYSEVPVKPRISRLRGVKASDSICRFVDLPKFLDLATTGELTLTSLGVLCDGDPFECCARKKSVVSSREETSKRIEQLIAHTPKRFSNRGYPYDQRSKLREELEGYDGKKLQAALLYVERKQMLKNVVCSCWHTGTAETDAMWKLYAGQLGVMLKSTVKRLESALITCNVVKKHRDEVRFSIGKVTYRDTPANHSVVQPWLVKRKAFVHEREIRLFAEFPYDPYGMIRIKADLEKLIEEIVVTPFAEGWQKRPLIRGIEAVLKAGNLRIRVRTSKHMRPPSVEWPTGEFGFFPPGLLSTWEA